MDTWAAWTRDYCARPESTGAPTSAALSGEGPAVNDFSTPDPQTGEYTVDVAYSGTGYDTTVGIGPSDVTARRSAVLTPVALDAAVIAVGGGTSPNGEKEPYPEIKLTAAEVGAIFGGGFRWVSRDDQPYAAAIVGRNPALGEASTTTAAAPPTGHRYLRRWLRSRGSSRAISPP